MGHFARPPSRQARVGHTTRQYASAVTSLALAWTCTATPARARGEPLTWSPEALALDAKGDELARARDYAAAHEAYRAAYRAMPDPIRYHLARDRMFGAMKSTLYSLYEETGELRHLCQIRRLLLEHWEELIIAFGEDTPIPDEPGIRRNLQNVEEDMRAHAPKPGETECMQRKRPDEPGPADLGRLIPPEWKARPNDRPVTVAAPTPAAPPARPEGAEPGPTAPSPSAPSDRRWQAHVGGGVALLLAGGGFAGGMIGALVRRGETLEAFRDLEAAIDREQRDATAEEDMRASDLNRRYALLTVGAGVSGAAAIAAIVGGAVILAKRPRRQLAALPWSSPHLAGLTLQLRF